MEAKLRSIIKGIHWSLALKGLIAACAWALLPEWVAWGLILAFYFSSFFRVKHLGLPLFAALIIAHIWGQNFWSAIFIGALFYLILGVKEFAFIDRRMPHIFIIFGILSVAGFLLYGGLDAWSAWLPIKISLFSLLFMALVRGFMLQKAEIEAIEPHNLVLWVMTFLLWEITALLAFLPLDFIYLASLAIFISFIFFEWLVAYSENDLNRNKILLYSSFLFILVNLIFGFAKWVL